MYNNLPGPYTSLNCIGARGRAGLVLGLRLAAPEAVHPGIVPAGLVQVQAAIEHNRRVFANRVRMEDRAIMKKAFDAWRAVRFGSIAKQQLLRRAIARLQRGLLARAFLAWKDKFHLVDKYHAMRKKVGVMSIGGADSEDLGRDGRRE